MNNLESTNESIKKNKGIEGPTDKILITDFESLSKIDRDNIDKDAQIEFSSAMKVASSIVLAKILAKSSSVGGVAKIAYNGIMQFIQNKDYLSVIDYASRFKELELGVVMENDDSEHDNYAALTEAYATKSDDDYASFGEIATEEDFDLAEEADDDESEDDDPQNDMEETEGEMEEFTDGEDDEEEY